MIHHRDTEDTEGNGVTSTIIGAAIDVHRVLGPGLLESAYQQCLCRELAIREVPFSRQVTLPVEYKGLVLDCSYRLDILVADCVVIEVKSIAAIEPVNEAQLLTYMRLGGWKLGLLINFNTVRLRDGISRILNR